MLLEIRYRIQPQPFSCSPAAAGVGATPPVVGLEKTMIFD
jgi:hypothetical protein